MEEIHSFLVANLQSLTDSRHFKEILSSTVFNEKDFLTRETDASKHLKVSTAYEFYKYAATFEVSTLIGSDMA